MHGASTIYIRRDWPKLMRVRHVYRYLREGEGTIGSQAPCQSSCLLRSPERSAPVVPALYRSLKNLRLHIINRRGSRASIPLQCSVKNSIFKPFFKSEWTLLLLCACFFCFIQKHVRPDLTYIIHEHALSKERKVQTGDIQCQGADIWKDTRMHDASMPCDQTRSPSPSTVSADGYAFPLQ